MSFPPRPPMGLGMPPGMMPQGYGYAPMGMMPMGMGMMPQHMMRQQGPPMGAKHKFMPQEIPPKGDENKSETKAPVTTVFVGNISEKAPDAMIRQMLQRCGNVLSWKRVQGASGKLQAFGFCEYEDPDATLRCIRLLNDWRISEKNLVVKVDAKTKAQLDDWKKKKWREKNKDLLAKKENKEDDREEGEAKESDDDDEEAINELDEFTLREDRVAKAGLDAIMREYSHELNRVAPGEKKEEKAPRLQPQVIPNKSRLPTDGPKDSSLEDMQLDRSTKDLINKEIKSFRDAHKAYSQQDEDPDSEREKEREREREMRRRIAEREDRERRDRERDRERERERDREREREKRDKERERDRDRDREREREKKRRTKSRSKSKSRDRDQEILEEEETYERRKLERKLREKEAQYQELLTKWEARERKKGREHDKEKERDEAKKSEEIKEGRRLKEFLEDYDDERDDPKYYKGSALQRRLKEREKEMEGDERDRQREKEEIEEIRRKLTEDGNPELEAEIAKLESEKDAHLMPRLNQPESHEGSPSPSNQQQQSPHSTRSHSSRSRSSSRSGSDGEQQRSPPRRRPSSDSQTGIIIPGESHRHQQMVEEYDDDDDAHQHDGRQYAPPSHAAHAVVEASPQHTLYEPQPIPAANGYDLDDVPQPVAPMHEFSASNSPDPPRKKKLTARDVFNQDDDEDSSKKQKRKLVPLDYGDEKKTKAISLPIQKPQTAEEKRKCIKNLIEKIPTAKEELFAYPLDWKMVDSTLMDRRIRPWVNKKIVEYIGDEEPTLSNFICEKVMTHSAPRTILGDIAMVFDEEAEVFVVKMWRLLIYETEAKKLGLVK